MSFADDYLQKKSLRGPLISTPPKDSLRCIVAIPSYNESGLVKCLDSLFLCDPPGVDTEVIVLINSPEECPEEIVSVNRKSYEDALEWKATHRRDDVDFHFIFVRDLPKKHAGAGLARKLVMDEALRRFDSIDNGTGIIMSLDVDAMVDKNYLTAVVRHFEDGKVAGCAVYFEHPLGGDQERGRKGEGEQYPQEVYKAIANYELHMRYYLQAVRYTGYPYAFHTIGSCFGVRATTYCSQGGMNKRQAGEDFYFIQKVARLGTFSDLTATTVRPSPRPSDRVLFGTGPDIIRQLENPGKPYMSYDLRLFLVLREFFQTAGSLYKGNSCDSYIKTLPGVLGNYLVQSDFHGVIDEIRGNVASEKTFMSRFFRHFNMLWILKFLHWAEEEGYGKVEVSVVARELLGKMGGEKGRVGDEVRGRPGDQETRRGGDVRSLLGVYRSVER